MDRHQKKLELVAKLLDSETTLALATAMRDGSAGVAPLFYLPQEGLRLYWFSSSTSEHSRNLCESPRAAVTVYRRTAEWEKIRGVQMRGAVSAVSDRALRRTIAKAYEERFQLGKLFEVGMSRSTLYCFQPDWVRYIDNSRRFGFRFELSLPRLRLDPGLLRQVDAGVGLDDRRIVFPSQP
jgi:uncharacterized protein YhbP (UPF0306 family)